MEEETIHHQDLFLDSYDEVEDHNNNNNSDDNCNNNNQESSSCYSSNVDTSRPFRSVKEAVEIFGERFLVGEIYSPKPFEFSVNETPRFVPSQRAEPSSPSSKSSSARKNDAALFETVKKLEIELEQTKAELRSLKEKESENEVALATLNAELHRNMSKLALAEVEKMRLLDRRENGNEDEITERDDLEDLRVVKNGMDSRTLAEILSLGDEGLLKKKEKKLGLVKKKKKKPIVPLVGDLFSKKKASSSATSNSNGALHNTLFSSSHLQWN